MTIKEAYRRQAPIMARVYHPQFQRRQNGRAGGRHQQL